MGAEEHLMPIQPKQRTSETQQVIDLLKRAFPNAEIDAYRQNSAVIRVRMIDDYFQGKSRVEREEKVLPVLRRLPDEILGDITLLLLLTPAETGRSVMNLEFEDPVPSTL